MKPDGIGLKGVSDLEAALVLEKDEKGNVTGITKILWQNLKNNIV